MRKTVYGSGQCQRRMTAGLRPRYFIPSLLISPGEQPGAPPRRILEIAAGTGVLTRELAAAVPWAEVTATDLNAAMVEFGSGQVPLAVWQQADALHLPFGGKLFDLVVCQFGVMFFPDKPAGFREMRRAAGYCTGTPLRNAIEARDDLTASTALIADQMTARLGPGSVTAKMTAHIIEARPA
jgi:SAM-dependent methyltransferase